MRKDPSALAADIDECKEELKNATGLERGAIFERMGDAYNELSKFRKALVCYHEAYNILGNRHELVEKYSALLDNAGDSEDGIKLLENALKDSNDLITKAKYHFRLGYIKWHIARYEDGKKDGELAVRILEDRDPKDMSLESNYGDANNVVGLNLWELGRYLEALATFEKALTSYVTAGNYRGISRAKNNVGLMLYQLGQLDEAIIYYKEAIEAENRSDSVFMIGTIYNNIGLVRIVQGEFAAAEDSFQKAIEHSRSTDYSYGVSLAQLNYADMYIDKMDFIRAKTWANRALTGFKTANEPARQAWIKCALSRVALHEKDLGLAEKLINDAHQMAKDTKSKDTEALALRGIGLVAAARKDYPAARKYLSRSLELFKRIMLLYEVGKGYKEMAIINKAEGDMDEMAKNAGEAKALFKKLGSKYELEKMRKFGLIS